MVIVCNYEAKWTNLNNIKFPSQSLSVLPQFTTYAFFVFFCYGSLGSVRRVQMGVTELSRLLTGGVTPTSCNLLDQAVQMVRSELCLPTVVVLEVLYTPSSFFTLDFLLQEAMEIITICDVVFYMYNTKKEIIMVCRTNKTKRARP